MEWVLKNPRKGLRNVFISETLGEKYFLYVTFDWSTSSVPVDDYPFPSCSGAKRYFSTHYQSIKKGFKKPIWININDCRKV